MTAATMSPAANDDATVGSSTRIGAAWEAAVVVSAAALFAIGHPYLGIVGDASLYLGRSLADLDPNGVGRDIVFANDGQSRFSIFSHLADPLVAVLGASRAGVVIALGALACLFSATWAFARALTDDRRVMLAIVVSAALMSTGYGDGVFRFAEATAVPRPFAEAAVMATVAALLAGRNRIACVFLLSALLIHPIMAMAGVGTIVVLLAWRRSLGGSLAAVSTMIAAAGLALILGRLGVPLFDRLALSVDPDWLGMLTERSPHLFPTLWHATAFAAPIVQVATIAVFARRGGKRPRVLAAVAISAILQLAAAAVLGDKLHGLLAIQVQGWRSLWLLAAVASFSLPVVAWDLWRGGPPARIALALLGMAWLCPLGVFGSLMVCIAALALVTHRRGLPLEERHATWTLVAVAAICVVDIAMATAGWAGFVRQAPASASMSIGLVSALRTDLLITPAWLAVALFLWAPRTWRPAGVLITGGTAALVAVAAWGWDQRASAAFIGQQDGFASTATLPGAPSSEVMVIGGVSSAWFALGRPQYFSPEQAVSIVFSRPLAMAWRRRARVLHDLGLVPHNTFRPWDPMTAEDHILVTAAKLAAFCGQDDAPAVVIVPDRDDAPAPYLPGATLWPLPAPQPIIENYDPPQWHVIRGWVVEPCAAPQPSELAKTGAR